MSQPKTSQLKSMGYLYNPANQTPQQLVDGFVIRQKELRRITNGLTATNFDSGAQHFLIEGQRGTGKTSLLLRVKYEIQNNADFENLIVVQFAEEQYNIFDLSRLWESTAEALEDTEGFENIVDEMDEHSQDDDYTKECFGFIERALIRQNKRLVLLLDNFGDILDKFSDIEQKRLRDIFHNCNHIQLIASSSRSLEHTYKHDKPFFEFFNTIKLDGLNKKDVTTLLERLADHNPDNAKNVRNILKNQPQRLETIRRLTAGIPRTIVLLFEIFADESANVFEDLELILDRVTPLYKHRMDDLPTQQQAIMDTIAMSWDGIGSKEIVSGLKKRGFNSKTVSAQLIALGKNGLVESKKIDKKNKLYFIRERFFNIWYLMRYGRKKNKDQVKWLVRFLEQWCSADELINRAKKHILCAKAGTLHSRGGYYMAEALAATLSDEDIQHELLTETKNALRKSDPDIDRKLSKSDIEIWKLENSFYEKGNFKQAMKLCKTLIDKGNTLAMGRLAWLYHTESNDYDAAIKYYKMAVENGDANAMNNLASIYEAQLKDLDSAITYYKMAIAKDNIYAMHNLALLYETKLESFDMAITYYKMAIVKGDAAAMHNFALLHQTQFKDFSTAKTYYKMAIEKGDVDSMCSLAFLYETELKNFDMAITYYKMAIVKGDTDAMHFLALLHQTQFKDFGTAKAYYKMAIEKGDVDSMCALAWLYQTEFKDFENAISYYKMAIEKDDTNAMNDLALLYYSINTHKAESLQLVEKLDSITKDSFTNHVLATIMLWHDNYQQSIVKIRAFIAYEEFEKYSDDMTEYFLLLLSKKQYHLALNLFNEFDNLKTQFKPIYYALMELLKDEYPKERLKMGSELEDTVQEILIAIENKPQK